MQPDPVMTPSTAEDNRDPANAAARQEREALGRIRTRLHSRILGYREEREKAERMLENLERLEASSLKEARAIDAMLELTNPYRKGKP